MSFIPLEAGLQNIIAKVQQDSGLPFYTWPQNEANPRWLWFDGNSLAALQQWLNPKCAEKLTYVNEQTDHARSVLGLTRAKDQEYYLKMFALIEPYLNGTGKLHPAPKFSMAITDAALAGFNSPDPADQETAFGVTEFNLSLDGVLTSDHLVNVFLTFTDGQRSLTKQINFRLPLDAKPSHIKPFLVKYLSDPRFTYHEGSACYNAFLADQAQRDPAEGTDGV